MRKKKNIHVHPKRFQKERKRQEAAGEIQYHVGIDKKAKSYWVDIKSLTPADIQVSDALSEFARMFIDPKDKKLDVNFTERAPEDIYPIF